MIVCLLRTIIDGRVDRHEAMVRAHQDSGAGAIAC
jgi:hypothetical protein